VPATDLTGQITGTQITDNAITTSKIAANSVTATQINAGAVTADKVSAGAISADKIAANAVTADKVAANAITAAKIAAGSIESDKLAANSVIAGKIAAGAVNADQIAANAVVSAKIAAGQITADKIATDAVTADKILAGSIITSKIAAGAVTANAIAANSITAENAAISNLAVERIKIANGALSEFEYLNKAVTFNGQTTYGSQVLIESLSFSFPADNNLTPERTVITPRIAPGQVLISLASGTFRATFTITASRNRGGVITSLFTYTMQGWRFDADGTRMSRVFFVPPGVSTAAGLVWLDRGIEYEAGDTITFEFFYQRTRTGSTDAALQVADVALTVQEFFK
jgi:hypothetical protein